MGNINKILNLSKNGYKKNSPDVNKPFNVIASNEITMIEDDGTPLKKGPILGIGIGNGKVIESKKMMPGKNYEFPEDVTHVIEIPKQLQLGGQYTPKERMGVRQNPDGSVSSHLMMSEVLPNGNWVSFPSLFQNEDGSWVDMSEKTSWYPIYLEALKRGEVYNFGKNKEAALEFGRGSWKKEYQKGGSIPKFQTGDEKYPNLFNFDSTPEYVGYQGRVPVTESTRVANTYKPTQQEIKATKEYAQQVGSTAQAIRNKTGVSQKEAMQQAEQVLQANSRIQPEAKAYANTKEAQERDAYVFDEGMNARDYFRYPLQFLAGRIPTEEERIQDRIRITDPRTSNLDKFMGTVGQATSLAPEALINTGVGLAFAPSRFSKLGQVVDAVSPIGNPTSPFNTRAQNDILVEQARRSGEATLPSYMEPYISRRYTPAAKEQDIFESFLSPEKQAELRKSRTQSFTPEEAKAMENAQSMGITYKDIKNYFKTGRVSGFESPDDIRKSVKQRDALIETFNWETGKYELYKVKLADRLVPGREYDDVKRKIPNLRKDLNTPLIEHLFYKYIGAGTRRGPSLQRDRSLVFDPETGVLFDSNTRYWLNREYGKTPTIESLLESSGSQIAKDIGTKLESYDNPQFKYQNKFIYQQEGGYINNKSVIARLLK